MSARTHTPRLAALAATGAAALSIAALATPVTAHAEGDGVIGPVTSVSPGSFEVAKAGGVATVEFTDATVTSQAIPAQRAEIAPGSCIKAGPTPDSTPADSGAITAKWVMISTPVDGQCSQRPGAAPVSHRGVRGMVDSVDGDTVTVTRSDKTTATVTVTDDTHFRRRVVSTAHAVTVGQCVVARGTDDANGVLQATRIIFWTPSGDHCPQPTG